MDCRGRLADRCAGGCIRGALWHVTPLGRGRGSGLPGGYCWYRSLDLEAHAVEARHSHGHRSTARRPAEWGSRQTALALSSDGKQLAYAAIRGINSQIYLRPMDSQEARPISGTDGASDPFFSPDGQWIGFFADGKLKKISVNGGRL